MEFDVTIEVPKGTRNKYEVDHRTGRIRLDRTLFTATQYPADYGYVENTIDDDGDPLDALVLVQEPTFPGCLIKCRAIGMLRLRKGTGADHKIVCVPIADWRLQNLIEVTDLEHFFKLEIQHFFEIYANLDPSRTAPDAGGWAGRTDAEAEIIRSFGRAATVAPLTLASVERPAPAH